MSGAKAGRPSGTSDAVRQREDELFDLRESGLSVEEVVVRTGGSPSQVYQMIRNARARRANPEAARPLALVDPASPPKPIRKMSQGTVLRRAWLAMHLDGRLRRVDGATRMFWQEVVVAIHEIGDGFALRFAETGFDDRADFAVSYDGNDDMLAVLVRRRVLLEPEDGTIALPPAMGLTQRERPGGKLLADAGRGRRHGDRRQGEILMAGGGERPDSGDSPGLDSGKTRSDSGEIQGLDSGKIQPEFLENPRPESGKIHLVGGESTTTTTTKDSESPLSGGGLESVGEGEAANFAGVDSGKITRNPPSVALAADFAVMMGRAGQPTPVDLATVRRWLDAGHSGEWLRGVIRNRLARGGVPANPAFSYFDGAVSDAISKPAPVAAPAAPAAAPVSDEDEAILDLIKPSSDAWAPGNGCPFPPALATFKAAVAVGDEALARRWVGCFARWNEVGRPVRGKPPDFTMLATQRSRFEKDLDAAEDELTTPDTPG